MLVHLKLLVVQFQEQLLRGRLSCNALCSLQMQNQVLQHVTITGVSLFLLPGQG